MLDAGADADGAAASNAYLPAGGNARRDRTEVTEPVVVVEAGGSGSRAAAPLARRILDAWVLREGG